LLGGSVPASQPVDETVEGVDLVGQSACPAEPVIDRAVLRNRAKPPLGGFVDGSYEAPQLLALLPVLEGLVERVHLGPVDLTFPFFLEHELMPTYCLDAARYEDRHDNPDHA